MKLDFDARVTLAIDSANRELVCKLGGRFDWTTQRQPPRVPDAHGCFNLESGYLRLDQDGSFTITSGVGFPPWLKAPAKILKFKP